MKIKREEGVLALQEKRKKESDGGGGGGKTVVVGIKMDAASRELLTWSLVKIAGAGDLVVALHVLPVCTPGNSTSTTLLSLVKAFDAMLSVYEGFCNLKQVELKMKIARGSSARKVLVREAISYKASRVVVGVSRSDLGIGYSSTSIAKYCARKLPQDCSVFAVSNGKTLFKREAPPVEDNKASNQAKKNKATEFAGQQALTRSYSKLLDSKAEKSRSKASTLNRSRSNCASIRSDEANKKETFCTQKAQSSALVRAKTSASMSLSLPHSSPDMKLGWPLLRKIVLPDRQTAPTDGSKISVVEWAMRLPGRFSAASTVHPDHKSAISDANASPRVDQGKKIPKELEKYSSLCRLFSYKELAHMTSNFSPERLIGKGGSSRVHKGCLSDGKELAVKILKPSEESMNEFKSEIEIITALHHKNIVSLFGFCCDDAKPLLVYEFLSRGSLEDNLHGEDLKKNSLGWAERYKVAVGIAEALDYLHGACNHQPVIHRDVKSSNILLSDDFEPQLADFGLAKWASASASQLTCNDVAGTFGYLAPEYLMYGKVNEKIDVYAFGVVLLELVSGRKPIATGCPKGQESLVMWAMPILQGGEAKELLDPYLGTNYNEAQLERMILAASLCIKRAPQLRPRIEIVLKLLQGDEDVLRWARSRFSTSLEESEELDDEAVIRNCNIQSHINLALQDIDDDSQSVSSIEPPTAGSSLEEYLRGRWSRSSSFD